jgi:phosphoglucosamine mutase
VTLRFGTDGVRGVANVDLTPELVIAFGRAAARVLGSNRFAIGRDTRASGPLLESALAAGLAAEGMEVERLGVIPTPGVAWVSATEGVAGAMISASHNPAADNGIKLFTPGGRKLADDVEERLEAELDRILHEGPVGSTTVGPIADRADERDRWCESLVETLEGRRLDGLRVAIDCAHGAASPVAPGVLSSLGALVDVLHAEPDGTNINEGAGSTHPEALQRLVVERGAVAGLAFDGDADRVLAVDEHGRLVDGDHLIAMCAIDLRDRGRLRDDTVVVTVMTNLGFRLSMAEKGINVVETQVGDRYVLEAMENGAFSLGGEQSGHVIFSDLASTGDGLLTGLQVLDLLHRSGRPLSALAAEAMTQLPQVLRSVRTAERHTDPAAALAADIEAVEQELGERGRVLVRPSGTEPVVRVMVEAPTAEAADQAAARLVAAVERL